MTFELLQALYDLESPMPSFFRGEALRYHTEAASREIARGVLTERGDPNTVRLMKDLLACRGQLAIREV